MIKFFTPKGTYGFLSNFYHSPFELEARRWGTVEHYFQASKATTAEDRNHVASASGPGESKRRGRAIELREDWEDVVGEPALHDMFRDEQGVVVHTVKDHYMFSGLVAKFTQSEELTRALLETGDEHLVEDSPTDYYWGCGKDEKGLNKLGRMLMLVRRDLPRRMSFL
jgi:N-glycosidase YbiA